MVAAAVSAAGLAALSFRSCSLGMRKPLVEGDVPALSPNTKGLPAGCSETPPFAAAASCFNLLFFLGLPAGQERKLPD
ncbi:hypothetical protein SAMN04487930_10972 [Cytophaga hutchinsonii ATCC 33406]|nr:hypothetical protein SAMN04487930_10972 [Cytophaga hutchinsonii ATCC 33406]